MHRDVGNKMFYLSVRGVQEGAFESWLKGSAAENTSGIRKQAVQLEMTERLVNPPHPKLVGSFQ